MAATHRQPRNSRRQRSAFSLLELLAVVTILGVIAAIILYRIVGTTDQAKEKVQLHQIAELNMAIEHYYMDNEAWPSALTDLVPTYLPDGIPDPPQGGTYGINNSTHRAEQQ